MSVVIAGATILLWVYYVSLITTPHARDPIGEAEPRGSAIA